MHQNYKVFIKDKLILFTEGKNVPIRDKHAIFYIYRGMPDLMDEFDRLQRNRKIKTLIVFRKKNIDKLFKEFTAYFKITKAAGKMQ